MKARIKYVELGSVAEELGIRSGDVLMAINDKPVLDIMDYFYYRDDDYLTLTIQRENGELCDFEIEKDYDETLGLVFENPIIAKAMHCSNKCIFCFIDQMPMGMRKSLYFKDDDSRLSFMMGNFITLTNMSDKVFQRMIDYRISPINISVHTVDSAMRVKMLGNRFAGDIKKRLNALNQADITMNGQVVLCPDYNDGKYLDETIDFLSGLYPNMASMAVVPLGLTKHRKGLPTLKPVDKAVARQIIAQIDIWQQALLKRIGTRFVFAADEFYLKAELAIPAEQYYEGYVQIENGVGLIRKFEDEVYRKLAELPTLTLNCENVVITSVASTGMMMRIQQYIRDKYHIDAFDIITVENKFFGPSITVSGLLTSEDILAAIGKHNSTARLLLPENTLNTDGIFLDDLSSESFVQLVENDVVFVPTDGHQFINILIGEVYEKASSSDSW